MKKIFILLTTLLSLSSLAFAHTQTSTQMTDFLLVQTAKSSSIHRVENQSKLYTLQLNNVSPYVNYFSERPKRQAGMLSLIKFMQQWYAKNSQSFSKDAPNAMFRAVIKNRDGEKHIGFAVELMHPVYDKAKHRLSYTISPLEDISKVLAESDKYHFTTLYIDDWCPGCSE